MNKGRAINRLKAKMKRRCNRCCNTLKGLDSTYVWTIDWCFTRCPFHIFINLMIKELDENG